MRWQFWIDRGGTFTDVVGLDPGGTLHVRKVPSDGIAGENDAGIAGNAGDVLTIFTPGGGGYGGAV